jgi:assimilatory nitrate reductase catalytic subunit
VRRGELFVPIHWNDHTASDARVGALVNPVVDPVSGEPEFKHTPARVEAVPTSWSGFVLSRRPLVADAALGWWTRIQGDGFLRYEIAGLDALVDAATAARRWLAADDTADWLEYADAAQAQYRAAYLVEDQLQAVLFLAHQRSTLPEPAWLSGLFAATVIDGDTRDALLAGRAPGSGASLDPGATVCSCFGVGRNTILQAVADGCRSPEALGERLRCGTNCGSCVPELRMIIAKAGANELAK